MKITKSLVAIATAGAIALGAGSLVPASAHEGKAGKNVIVVSAEEYDAAYAQYLIDLAAYEVAIAEWEAQVQPLKAAAQAEIASLKTAFEAAIVSLTADEIAALKAELKTNIHAVKDALKVSIAELGTKPAKPAKPVLATDLPVKDGKKGKKKGKK